jgi:glycosyltransferase involved in cell wall biosynthesis
MAYVLANQLVALGNTVHVFCIDDEKDSEEEDNGVRVTRINCGNKTWGVSMFEKREQVFLPRLLASHSNYQYDLLHDVGGFLYFTVLKQFRLLTQVPLISHLLILMKPFMQAIHFDAAATRMFHDLQMLQCKFSDGVIATSRNDMEIILQDKDLRNKQIDLIYNAIEIPPVDEASIGKWKSTLPQEELIFLMGARVNDKNKGVPCAVQFIELLNARGIKSKLVITDPSNPATVPFSSDNVIFLGRLADPDYYSLMAAADASICASKYEAFGLVAIESAFFNKPVIATRTGIHTEVIGTMIDGLLIDQEELTSGSERLINYAVDISAGNKTNNGLPRKIPEIFSREHWIGRILEKYRSVLHH